MKARIKATGEIVKLAEYAKITLDMCDSYGNPIELKPEDVELISDDNGDTSTTDWNQARVQASIGAMQVILGKNNYDTYKDIAAQAVGYADALIKELKK
ncbi:MAG: hypothetical protein J6V00_05290 [Bacteroidaceae bacterium]|nr:hypothetical protein [Bacteroidaceae bacterium]